MTFYTFAVIDVLLAVILALHISVSYAGHVWKTVLSALDVCAHIFLSCAMFFFGCSPEEMLILLLCSAVVALALGLRDLRRRAK